jgi:hypothetical protein
MKITKSKYKALCSVAKAAKYAQRQLRLFGLWGVTRNIDSVRTELDLSLNKLNKAN